MDWREIVALLIVVCFAVWVMFPGQKFHTKHELEEARRRRERGVDFE